MYGPRYRQIQLEEATHGHSGSKQYHPEDIFTGILGVTGIAGDIIIYEKNRGRTQEQGETSI